MHAGEYDAETGWYYLQSRYYDPAVGRFLNADDPTMTLLGQSSLLGTNLFAYCQNNPVKNIDPIGWFSIPSWFISGPIDGIILWLASTFQITWLGYMAPLKYMAKRTAAS